MTAAWLLILSCQPIRNASGHHLQPWKMRKHGLHRQDGTLDSLTHLIFVEQPLRFGLELG